MSFAKKKMINTAWEQNRENSVKDGSKFLGGNHNIFIKS